MSGAGQRKAVMTEAPWSTIPTGVMVFCRLTPKGGRDAIEGVATLADGAQVFLARVRAAPEDGRANRALCALFASSLGVPASHVTIVAGAKSRVKRIAVSGDAKMLADRLTAVRSCA